MRRSHCHDSSKAGTALLEEAKLPQSFEAIPDGTSCVGMAHADLDTIAFQNAFQKAFTGAAVVLTVDTRLAKNEKIPRRPIEEEAILLALRGGGVPPLHPAGAEIWSALDGRHTV